MASNLGLLSINCALLGGIVAYNFGLGVCRGSELHHICSTLDLESFRPLDFLGLEGMWSHLISCWPPSSTAGVCMGLNLLASMLAPAQLGCWSWDPSLEIADTPCSHPACVLRMRYELWSTFLTYI